MQLRAALLGAGLTVLVAVGCQRTLSRPPGWQTPLRHLMVDSATGPLLLGWNPKPDRVRFSLTQKVPLSLELEGRAEVATTATVVSNEGKAIGTVTLGPEWSRPRLNIAAESVREGSNELVLTAENQAEWRPSRLEVANAQPQAAEPGPTDERVCLAFGRSHELPLLLQPGARLAWDDLQPWIEPGAPSLQSPWQLTVRIQGEGLDQSWQFPASGTHDVPLPVDVPTQVCLSILATSVGVPGPGQSGLLLRNPRLQQRQVEPTPTVSTPTPVAPSITEPPNIVLYLIDTLRADRLHKSTTPHLDALARDGVRFQCTAQSSWTKASVASIMTSLLPNQHGAQDFPDRLAPSHDTLATVLHSAGYETRAVVANPFLSRDFGFAAGFDSYRENPDADAQELNRMALSSLQARRPGKQPFFLYVHVLDPHLPYSPPPRFRPPGGPPAFSLSAMKQLREAWERRPGGSLRSQVRKAVDLYDGEVASCDQAFGDFVRDLKFRGLYDNTLIVLVSDHGEQFFEHNLCDHMNSLYQELLQVPLIIKFPRSQGGGTLVKSLWQHIDIAPTLLRQAGSEIPSTMEGLAYVPGGPEGRTDRPAFFSLHVGNQPDLFGQGLPPDGAELRADMDGVRVGPWVFHRMTHTIADVEPLQLFRLDQDPAERTNLAFARPAVRAWLDALLNRQKRAATGPAPSAPEAAVRDSLRALQYLR